MEEFVVDFVDIQQAISVPEKTTLWEAAQKLKICEANACINAEHCLSCKILLQEGMIDYPLEPESSPRGNIVLACLAKILSPCKVAFVSEGKSQVPLRSELEEIPPSEWALQNNGLFGFRLVSLEGPDPFEVLEQDLLKHIAHPGILALECDYGGWRKLQSFKKIYVSYACLPGRAKILQVKEQTFSIQVFALILGTTHAELVVWNPLWPRILYHTIKPYSALQSPYLSDLLRKAQRQSSLDSLLGGIVAGTPQQLQSFLGLARPPYITRPTELEKLSITGFPNAIVYPLQQGLAGNSSLLNATTSYLKTRSTYSLLVDFSEKFVLACSPQQSWASFGTFTFPERSEKIKTLFSEREWLEILLKIYQSEKSPSPRMWLNPAHVPKEYSDSLESRSQYAYKRIQEISSEFPFSPESIYQVLQGWNWLWQVVLAFSQKLPKTYDLWITGKQKPPFLDSLKQAHVIDPTAQWLASPALRGVVPALLNRETFVALDTLSIECLSPEEATRIQL